MFKHLEVNLYLTLLLAFFLIPVSSNAADVPFEVVKTEVVAETTVSAGSEGVAVDGILYDDAAEGEKFGYPPPEGEYDKRTKIPVDSIHYKIEFWNVGKMGGEKGFIFKSSYEKAKLTITYNTGQAYKMEGTGEKFFGIESVEKKNVSTPGFKDTFSYDLSFTGGPYGKFFHTDKDGKTIQVAYIENGKYIHFTNLPERRYLIYYDKALIEITNSSAFEKWMELINPTIDCSEIDNPRGDSGVRFSDYSGEVMVRACDDEDGEYGAELDMVLHNNDIIRTGDDSTCVLSLADMTTFVMKPESMLIMGGGAEESKLHLIWGKVKTNFKRMMKDGTMDVEMFQAVAGIKGTILITEENGHESTLKVLKGEVEFTSKVTGDVKMVGPGEMVTATEDGLGEKIEFDTDKEEATWENPAETESVTTVSKDGEETTKNMAKNNSSNQENKNDSSNNNIFLLLAGIIIVLSSGFIYHKKNNSSK